MLRMICDWLLASALTFLIAAAAFSNDRGSIFLSKEEAGAIKSSLEEYALLNKSFKQARDGMERALSHPVAVPPPGKLFHQTLNEAVWLVYVSQAYDCIYDWLSGEDRKTFEKNIFVPMVEWLAVKNQHEFNRIHNHGTWAAAAGV